MTSADLNLKSQAADAERRRLGHLLKFKNSLEILRDDELSIIRSAATEGGMSAHHASDRMNRGGGAAALLVHVPQWIADQQKRVDGVESQLAAAAAHYKAERAVAREEDQALVEAFRDRPAAEVRVEETARRTERNARVAAKASAALKGE